MHVARGIVDRRNPLDVVAAAYFRPTFSGLCI